MKIFHRDACLQLEVGSASGKQPIAADAANWLQSYTDRNHRQLTFPNPEALADFFDEFRHVFTHIEAAGGIVEHPDGTVLTIFRLGTWDLPKGKIDEGESVDAAAIREVQEETGLGELLLLEPLDPTYHIYKLNYRWVFKTTHWFRMKAVKPGTLVPQESEDITAVEWTPKAQLLDGERPTYAAIRELLTGYLRRFPK